jgi:ankyrin repeat protein
VGAKAAASYTGLHAAAGAGHVDVVSLLLENGADPNAKADNGDTPFARAAHAGQSQAVRLLVEAGGDVDDPPGRALGEVNDQEDNVVK